MNCNLGPHWEKFIRDEIASGRYLNQSELIRDALRGLERKRIEEFNAVFTDYHGAPAGEPSRHDQAQIKATIKAVRSRRKKQRDKAA